MTVLFWFRQDLRVQDNPGLQAAVQAGPVLPIYIIEPASDQIIPQPGSVSRAWLYQALSALNAQGLGGTLSVYQGEPLKIILNILSRYQIKALYWNRGYDPHRIEEDTRIKRTLKSIGIEVYSFNGSLLCEPWEVLKSDGSYYKVFTPFYRAWKARLSHTSKHLGAPENPVFLSDENHPLKAEDFPEAQSAWFQSIKQHWEMGELAASARLQGFIRQALKGYATSRDRMDTEGTSKLSPYLHHGELSIYRVYDQLIKQMALDQLESDAECFLKELCWREFSYYLLYHFPALPRENFQSTFTDFPWIKEPHPNYLAWTKGETGYPLIDAGMKELWQTGYMHNRVRMLVASFLVKNLNIHWRLGATWFLECLVDADLASNSASWQWVAGCGVDAAPYFRIFNPTLQAQKFDPQGLYIRRYLPALQHVPTPYLFEPWKAPQAVLEKAGVKLGFNYPYPIIDFKSSREQALEARFRVSS